MILSHRIQRGVFEFANVCYLKVVATNNRPRSG